MQITADQIPLFIAVGALALGIAFILWALRTSDGARGAAKRYKDKANDAESSVAELKSVLGAHPGVILVWQGEDIDVEAEDITPPDIHGSPVALASLLRKREYLDIPLNLRICAGPMIVDAIEMMAARR